MSAFLRLVLIITIITGIKSFDKIKFPDEKVDDYFSSFVSKDPPLQVCTGINDGILYRLPQLKTCQLPKDPKNTSTIDITLWWEDIDHQKLRGQECYATTSNVTCKYYMLQGCDYSFTPVVRVHLSEHDCRQMIVNKTINGNKLSLLSDGYWGTTDNRVPEGSYWYWETIKRTNYFVRHVAMTVNNVDNTIMTLAGTVKACAASTGKCETNDGFVMWDVDKVKECRLKQGDTTKCLKTDNILSCPDIEMSLTIAPPVKVCKQYVGFSNEGLLFTSNAVESTSIPQAISTVQAIRYFGKQGAVVKVKRSVTTFATTAEVNSKSHYLFDIVRDARVAEIQNIHLSLCKSTQAIIRTVRYAAENGDPNMMVGTLLFDGKYKAKIHGDVVALWKCQPIREYRLGDRAQNCTAEWPVTYVYQNQNYNGWMRPISHEVVAVPTPVGCPPASFYFDTGNGTILLTDQTFHQHLPYIPSLDAHLQKEPSEPEPQFRSRGVYDPTKSNDLAVSFDLQASLAENNRLEDIFNKNMNSVELTTEEKGILSAWISTIWKHLVDEWKLLWVLFYVAVAVVVVVVVCVILKYTNIACSLCKPSRPKRSSGVFKCQCSHVDANGIRVYSPEPSAPIDMDGHYSLPALPARNKPCP